MSIQANITSVQVLDDFKVAVIKFVEESALALNESEGEITRTLNWIQRDCQTYWTKIIRKKQEEVTMCKSALFRKQITPSPNDQRASVVDEKKALQKAIAQLEEAERCLKNAKKWAVELERQYAIYKGAVQGLSAATERDLPNAIARLSRMARALDDYLRMPSPDLRDLLDGAAGAMAVSSMKRTGDDRPAAAPTPSPTTDSEPTS
jgi:hypothetical protein